jgi:hypothetical protein
MRLMPKCGFTRTLFTKENPGEVEEGQDCTANLNPNSLEVIATRSSNHRWERGGGSRYQFERLGYFCVDGSKPGNSNGGPARVEKKPSVQPQREFALKDSPWAKVEKRTFDDNGYISA